MYPENTKKPGRPPLSPEEREARRIAKNKRGNARQKERGYPARKSYVERHKGEIYEPKLRIPSSNKQDLERLLSETGLTITQLFVGAVKEKYGVDLSQQK